MAAWFGSERGRMQYDLDRDLEVLTKARDAIATGLLRQHKMQAHLHYEYGGGTAVVAAAWGLEGTIVVHQHVLDIIAQEDPDHVRDWTVDIVYDPEWDERGFYTRPYSIIVPGISMPAFGSLCDTLEQRWGWREFYRPALEGYRPKKVEAAIRYPGTVDLLCVELHYVALHVPQEQWEEHYWVDWERELLEDPESFEDFEKEMNIDWADSPWHKRPYPRLRDRTD